MTPAAHLLALSAPGDPAEGVRSTAAWVAPLFGDLPVRARVVADAAAAARAAAEPGVEAVVVAGRGVDDRGRPRGEVTVAAATTSDRPVVVALPGGPPAAPLRRLLLPVEAGAPDGGGGVGEAMGLAARAGVEVVVLHVHAPSAAPAFEDQPGYAQSAWEREFAARHLKGRSPTLLLRHVGAPADRIVEGAQLVGADLIVLAWKRDLSGDHAAVVRGILAHSPMPVLLLPAG